MRRSTFAVLTAIIVMAGASFAAESPKAEAGATLLDQRCSVCHPSARPKGVKKSAEQWESTVTRMIGKGAKLSAEEKKTLVDYLAKTYKP